MGREEVYNSWRRSRCGNQNSTKHIMPWNAGKKQDDFTVLIQSIFSLGFFYPLLITAECREEILSGTHRRGSRPWAERWGAPAHQLGPSTEQPLQEARLERGSHKRALGRPQGQLKVLWGHFLHSGLAIEKLSKSKVMGGANGGLQTCVLTKT